MAYDEQNVFAKILRGEMPCIKVYEDEHTLSFMDVMPQADGHVLVIAKEYAVTLHDVSPEGAAACIKTTQKVSRAVQEALGAPGVLVMQINGTEAGQTVPHIHFHIIPSSISKVMARGHGATLEKPEKLQGFAQRIRTVLNSQNFFEPGSADR